MQLAAGVAAYGESQRHLSVMLWQYQ